MWPYIENLNGNDGTRTFKKFAHVLNVQCNGSRWRTPHRVTLVNLLSARDRLPSGARLQRQRQSEQEGRQSERTEVRQARVDR